MQQQVQSQPNEAFLASANLAALLANPISFLHRDHIEVTGMSSDDIIKLSSNISFQRPLNNFIGKLLGIDEIKVSESFVSAVSEDRLKKVAIRVATMQRAELELMALHVSAAILHRKILECVAREKRQAIVKRLGEPAFNTAIREAVVFFPELGKLGRKSSLKEYLPDNSNDEEHTYDEFALLGYRTILSFITGIESDIARLLKLRLPLNTVDKLEAISELTEVQMQQLARLFNMKAGWQ